MTDTVTPYRIDIPQPVLDDLAERLARTRLPGPLPGDGWDTGVPVAHLARLVAYWRDDYDWRAQEAALNRFPQFTTVIDGQLVHLVHVRSAEPGALPLLLTHGWPGSFVEFLGIVDALTDPVAHGGRAEDAFDVVIPSIPGFGFSGPVTEAWDLTRTAAAWAELMRRLGYDRFGLQGGDLGATVGPRVGRLVPDRVVGVHTNGGPGPFPRLPLSPADDAALSDLDRDRVRRIEAFLRDEGGYLAIQSTRPQTLSYGLTDSPAGQLAWVVDKLRAWTWPLAAPPEDVLGIDRLLTDVMLYWLTGTAGSSAYVGYATAAWGAPQPRSTVPTAALVLAHDVGIRRFSETENTITRWTDVDHGGHFAAMEEPALLVADLRAFFGPLRHAGRPAR